MWNRVLGQLVGAAAAIGLIGASIPALASGDPYEGLPAAISLRASGSERAVLAAAPVRDGDRLFFVGAHPPTGEGLSWQRIQSGDQVRWEARAVAAGTVEMRVDGASLPVGEVVVIGLDRPLADGSMLQTNRQLTVGPGGVLVEGPGSVARLRRGFRVKPAPGATLPVAAQRDDSGRVLVDAADPGLEAALADALEVVPFVTAEVMAGMAVGTITGSNDLNVPFTNEPCGGPYLGSTVVITTAPATAEIIGTDITYRVYHSVDISKFQVAGFRGGISGYSQTDFVYLYQRTLTGSTILERTHTDLDVFDGRLVNYLYLVGCCNYANSNTAYLDRWSITFYFTESSSPSIDLVADSIVAGPTTVAAGASTSAVFSGHVGGSGTVGGPFGIGFYLSPDSNITTGDVHLQTLNGTWGSAPPDTFGFGSPGVSLTIPGGTAAGAYYLGMIVDSGGVIAEVNEANNAAWTTITVASAGAKPNLEAVSCSVSPTTATAGSSVSFTSRGRNSGSVGASDFVWGIYLSTDATITPGGDTRVMALDVPGGWNAGYDSGDVARSVPLPGSLPDGTYHVGIYFDTGNQVSETNEGDNACSAMLTVGSGGGGGASTWILPAAAAAPGFGGANWTGQVEITNPGSTARTATLYYVAKGQPWPGTVLSGPHALGANQSWYLDNPVGSLSPTTGLLYVVFDAAGPRANSRIFVLNPDGSTYGQGIPGIPMFLAPGSTQVIAPVHSQPGVYHANLGLVHPAVGSYTVEVSIYSAGGSLLATKPYSRSQAWEQIDNLFADMGLGSSNVQGAWIKVRVTSGSQVWAYVSLVDDRTKDPTFLWDLGTLLP